jgi:2-haloacid dehalogenase
LRNKISRREFVQRSGITASGLMLLADSFVLRANEEYKIKAVIFDGFPIFDPRPIFEKTKELFPEKGNRLNEIWRSNQFSYQWLRVAANKYKDFWELTMDALDFAATACGIRLTMADKITIMNKYNVIDVWPDVIPSLKILNSKNIKLCILSNMTTRMLNQGIQNSNTVEFFDNIISTDQKKTFKPNPVAYQMGIDALQFNKEEILFVASAAWDMAGAKWFGYPTFWINRLDSPTERLDAEPDGVGKNLNDLMEFLKKNNS